MAAESFCRRPSCSYINDITNFSIHTFIVNDIKNFVFGLVEATVYGFCKSRKQKFVMSFTIGDIHILCDSVIYIKCYDTYS